MNIEQGSQMCVYYYDYIDCQNISDYEILFYFFNGPQIILNGMPEGPLNPEWKKNRFCRPVTQSRVPKKSTKSISDPSSGLFYSTISEGLVWRWIILTTPHLNT